MNQGRIGAWFDRVMWGLVTAVAFYASTQMKEMSTSIGELNVKLTRYIERSDTQARAIDDHETRIRVVEKELVGRNNKQGG